MFSASPSYSLPTRVSQLCRLLLRVRLIVAAFAAVLLPSATQSTHFVYAFIAALLASALAYLLWRRIADVLQRHPVLVGLDVIVSFLALLLGGRFAPFLLCTVITSAIVGLLYRWLGVVYVSMLQVTCYYAVLFLTGASLTANFQTLIGQPLYYPLLGFLGVWIRRLLDEHEESEELRRRAEVHAAAAEERARLARDMHDSLAKTVRGMAMAASALPLWVNRSPQRATEEARRLAAAADVATREARELLTALRTEDGLRRLGPAVRSAVDAWTDETGISTRVELDADAELPAQVRDEAVAICAEALANVDRHARAENVTVRLTRIGDTLRLTVADDGVGFDLNRREALRREGHYGLTGMTERAERAGLRLDLSSTPGEGTTVRLTFPATAPEPAADDAAPAHRSVAVPRMDAKAG